MSDYLSSLLARSELTPLSKKEELVQPRLAGLFEPKQAEGSLLSSPGEWGKPRSSKESSPESTPWANTPLNPWTSLSSNRPVFPLESMHRSLTSEPLDTTQPTRSFNPPGVPFEPSNDAPPSGSIPAGSRWASEVRARNLAIRFSNWRKALLEHPGEGISLSVNAVGSDEPDEQESWQMAAKPSLTGKRLHLEPRLTPSILPEKEVVLPPPSAQAANADRPLDRQPGMANRYAVPAGEAHLQADSELVETFHASSTMNALSHRLRRLEQAARQEQTIHISIGRIEIRATQASVHKEKAKPPSPPLLSLDEYLRQRSGGDRQP